MIAFKMQYTARLGSHTIDCNDPDLQVFESNLPAIIRARELGENSALVSHLCSNATVPQLVGSGLGVSRKDDAQENPTVTHHLIASLIQTIHHMILKQHRMEAGRASLDSLLCCCLLVCKGNLLRHS